MKDFLLLLLIFIIGCEKENSVDPTEGFEGIYHSTSFIEPGSHDGGIDIISLGGYLTIEFESDFRFTGERYVPDDIDSNYPPGKTLYEGKYTLKNDSIVFNEDEFFIEHLVGTTDKIELKYERAGRGFLHIILLRELR